MRRVTLTVNRQRPTLAVAAKTPLLFILRNDLGLHGPKYGCGVGVERGACTAAAEGRKSWTPIWTSPGPALRWSRFFGQLAKLGSPERKDELDDGEADKVFCGIQSESRA